MNILDSNIIIYLSKRIFNVDNVIFENQEYAISIITYMEVLGYDFESEDEEIFIKELLQLFTLIYINERIVQKVIELRKKYKLKLPDAIICASVIENNAKFITNDIRLQNIEELEIQSIIRK
ncbi:MAG: type II toxin-antitoxin system VapC family toxin [Candidatus Cloacimonetes bacterium]|nr:type II toxin-antitoxin system VapC family toxin [Candidatus Cloacimonadota bacterium]